MPMMADLDDPRPPRTRTLLLAFALAAPITLGAGYFGIPAVRKALVSEAADYDRRLRQEDAYMKTLCTQALVLERDEELCECALAAEYPSLDCRQPFMAWTLEQQHKQCSVPEVADQALAFCSCVGVLHEEAAKSEDDTLRRKTIQRYAACAELDDALHLPTLESLVPEGS